MFRIRCIRDPLLRLNQVCEYNIKYKKTEKILKVIIAILVFKIEKYNDKIYIIPLESHKLIFKFHSFKLY